MYKLQELLESALHEIVESDDCNLDANQLEDKISKMIPDVCDETATDMLASIKEDAFSGGLEEARTGRREFERRLMEVWKKPIELLELFVSLATEAGVDFNSEFGNEAVSSDDYLFEALTRLHGRACQVSNEILVLLRSGYADGAHARWRTLHEIAVISFCLSEPEEDEHRQELAEKYLLHDTIQRYKLACQYQKYGERLDLKPIPQEEFDNLQTEYNKLIARFCKPFEKPYGWAASPKSPTMTAIEERVELAHWRPYYKMASDNVHANAHGSHFRLGLAPLDEDMILAGPSNAGLVDPGHSTAISLNQITAVLLGTRSNFDCAVVLMILQKLVNEIGEAFLEAHNYVEMLSNSENETESAT
ncbi:MAG: hypothetical protein F4X57_09660 [Chloroflexi bacterium]|nr:hypothetical protein [Chloroflexota bacterium]